MANEVILVQPLHDDDDAASPLVVETGEEGIVVPVVDRLSANFGESLVRLQRIVDDDDVGAAAGQDAAVRS